MKIPRPNLIVALLAVLSSLPFVVSSAAVGQDANTVDIRTTAPPARRGFLAADVSVERNRVHVGETVTVKLVAPAGISRPLFIVSFGDGNKQETTKTQIDHRYGKVGHYDVYAWVTQTKDPPPRLSVSLSANPKLVQETRPVKFNAQLKPDYPGIKYRFVFGDKADTGWQDQSETAHAYDIAGTYMAYVDIGGLDNGSFTFLSRSARQPIQVTSAPLVSVDLSITPSQVEVAESATFTALSTTRDPNTRYRFVFGDSSSPTGWQVSSQVPHAYDSAGTYFAYVEISTGRIGIGGPSIRSARKSVQVVEPQRVSVELEVNPAKVETEKQVTFAARTNSSDRNIKYRFSYGDGSSSDWQTIPRSRHKYYPAGDYFAYVEAGLANNNQAVKVLDTSKKIQVTVTASATPTPTPTPTPTTPTPTPTPVGSPTSSPGASPNSSPVGSPGSSPGSSPGGSPSLSPGVTPTLSPGSSPPFPPAGPTDAGKFPWWYLLIALLIVGAGYWAFKALFVPRPTFRSCMDGGKCEVDQEGKPLAIESQILLKPNIADGQYLVGTNEGNLIQSVRREND